jgi:hypothetical protein
MWGNIWGSTTLGYSHMKMKIHLYRHVNHCRLSNTFLNRTYKNKSHANEAGEFSGGDACEQSTGPVTALQRRMENLRQYGNKNWHPCRSDPQSKPVSKWTTMTPWDDNDDHTAVETHTTTACSVGIKLDRKAVKILLKKYAGLLRIRQNYILIRFKQYLYFIWQL